MRSCSSKLIEGYATAVECLIVIHQGLGKSNVEAATELREPRL